MFSKRLFVISLFTVIVIVGLSNGQPAKAQESPAQTQAFTPLIYEPLDISLEGACQATENAARQWLFGLPVSQELLTELENSAADGSGASIEIGTTTDIHIDGNGSAQLNEAYELLIFDDTSGQETVVATAVRTVTGPHHDGLGPLQLEDVIISSLNAGDVLLVKARFRVVLQAEACSPSGQAPALSMTKHVDTASPLIYY